MDEPGPADVARSDRVLGRPPLLRGAAQVLSLSICPAATIEANT